MYLIKKSWEEVYFQNSLYWIAPLFGYPESSKSLLIWSKWIFDGAPFSKAVPQRSVSYVNYICKHTS